ncbi:hypothetical protein FW755_12625 [Lonepinella koalarum]|nr:hypothetical protein FW755_12625 [Lonepinella koalarum]
MNLPDDYFLDTDDEMLAYLENQAKISINEGQKGNENNREKAYRLLNYLILGIGSIALILLNQPQINPIIGFNALLLMVGWTIAILELMPVILSKTRPISANLPQFLYNESFKTSTEQNKLGILRRYELHNLNQSVLDLIEINKTYRKQADRAIKIAVGTPVLLTILTAILIHFIG